MSLSRSLCLWRSGRALLRRKATENAYQLLKAPAISAASSHSKARLFVRFYSEESTASDSDSSSSSSSSSDSGSDRDDSDRLSVLDAALKFVPELGWSEAALVEGAKVANIVQNAGEQMFPRGAAELVDHFEEECNRELNDIMEKLVQEQKLEGSTLVRTSVEQRLRMLIPYIEKWPQALAVKAIPMNLPSSLENLGLLVDDIWYFAGDRSTDMNWYTKRALLGALYSSTELYMIQDKSDDFQDTWKFLQNRTDEVKVMGKACDDFEGMWSGAREVFAAAVTTVRNMAGHNSEDRGDESDDSDSQ